MNLMLTKDSSSEAYCTSSVFLTVESGAISMASPSPQQVHLEDCQSAGTFEEKNHSSIFFRRPGPLCKLLNTSQTIRDNITQKCIIQDTQM